MSCTRPLRLAVAIAAVWFSFFIFTIFTATPAQAASVQLSWAASTSPNVAGYKVYSGPGSKNYTSTLDAGYVVSVSIGGLLEGQTYYFAVTAYNTSGIESGFSNEINVTPSSGTSAPRHRPWA
jgi:Fibronectin type III domain